MDFDINLILVPTMLVFLLVYLADKFWLKQHKGAVSNNKQISVLERNVADSQANLGQALKSHAITSEPEFYVPNDTSPQTLVDAYEQYNAHKRKLAELKANTASEHFLVRWAYEFLPVLVFLVVVRTFIAEPFNIPSSSMVPSLYTGDFIVVNKAAYGLRLPIIHTKIWETGKPKGGDVVVFRYPKNEKIYYIKRVIGTPGDTVRFDGDSLTINGVPLPSTPTNYTMPKTLVGSLYPKVVNGVALTEEARTALGIEEESYARYYQETHGAHSYLVRYLGETHSSQYAPFLQTSSPLLASSGGMSWELTVPDGKYFVMGDNRDRSEDARFWGFVDERHLAGKATYIWMHKKPGLALPSFGRAGKID